jgi:hypothetical protein
VSGKYECSHAYRSVSKKWSRHVRRYGSGERQETATRSDIPWEFVTFQNYHINAFKGKCCRSVGPTGPATGDQNSRACWYVGHLDSLSSLKLKRLARYVVWSPRSQANIKVEEVCLVEELTREEAVILYLFTCSNVLSLIAPCSSISRFSFFPSTISQDYCVSFLLGVRVSRCITRNQVRYGVVR